MTISVIVFEVPTISYIIIIKGGIIKGFQHYDFINENMKLLILCRYSITALNQDVIILLTWILI